MLISRLQVGPLQANCYVVGCAITKEAAVIDPGGDPEMIIAELQNHGLCATKIINTHGHADHIAANDEVREFSRAPLLIHEADAAMLTDANLNLSAALGTPIRCRGADGVLDETDEIIVGRLACRVLHTPGHTPGSVCLLVGNALFSGDTLFRLSVGRSDFPGGNAADLKRSIEQKLFRLPVDTIVYTGHGDETEIGYEIAHNPFVGTNARFRLG